MDSKADLLAIGISSIKKSKKTRTHTDETRHGRIRISTMTAPCTLLRMAIAAGVHT